jgi:prepilin-type processing-associated H-X9-DG protein
VIDTWYGINADWEPPLANSTFPVHLLPDYNTGSYAHLPKLGSINHNADMVWLYDGIFYDLNYSANRINARHNRFTKTNLLFFDGHAGTFDTASLPGGIGNANSGPGGDPFNIYPAPQSLLNDTAVRWRTDY